MEEDEGIIYKLTAEIHISKEQAKRALEIIKHAEKENESGRVSESLAPYFKLPAMISRSDILNHALLKEESARIFQELIALTKLPLKFLAENVFEVTPKTFAKYRDEKIIMPSRISELAFKLKQLYQAGIEIFGSPQGFNSWLHEESYGLGNHKPDELLNTSIGIDLVFEELKRIEFGATA